MENKIRLIGTHRSGIGWGRHYTNAYNEGWGCGRDYTFCNYDTYTGDGWGGFEGYLGYYGYYYSRGDTINGGRNGRRED